MLLDPRSPEEIASDPLVVNVLWLIKNGVPFDVAWLLSPNQIKAWGVVLATFEGGRYDWEHDEWKDRDAP